LNGELHAVSIGKPSERMSNFWMVQFLKTKFEQNFIFPHIPNQTGGDSEWLVLSINLTCGDWPALSWS